MLIAEMNSHSVPTALRLKISPCLCATHRALDAASGPLAWICTLSPSYQHDVSVIPDIVGPTTTTVSCKLLKISPMISPQTPSWQDPSGEFLSTEMVVSSEV
jgi:hypothetical protein